MKFGKNEYGHGASFSQPTMGCCADQDCATTTRDDSTTTTTTTFNNESTTTQHYAEGEATLDFDY